MHGVRGPVKAVAMCLALHYRDAHSPAYPGVERLASMANIGVRQVRDALAELEAMGWMTREPGTGRGPGNPVRWLLDFDAMREPAREFDRTKGATLIAAKAPPVGRKDSRGKAPRAGRNSDAAMRPFASSNAPFSALNAPFSGGSMRPTGVNEVKSLNKSNEEQRENARDNATAEAPLSLSPSKGGGKPEPLNPDFALPDDWRAIVKAARTELTDDDIALSLTKFRVHHDGAEHPPDRWRKLITTWLLQERAAPQPRLGRNGSEAWMTSKKAVDAEAARLGIKPRKGDGYDVLIERIRAFHETPQQKRTRVADEIWYPSDARAAGERDITGQCEEVDALHPAADE